jgi:hypothetical protein
METTVKNASQLAGETIDIFKEVRRKRKIEKAEAEKQSEANRMAVIALIATALLVACIAQRIFF